MAHFNGTWILDGTRSEDIEALLNAVDVGFIKRKLLSNMSQTLVVSHTDTEMIVDQQTSIKNKSTNLKWGGDFVDMEEELTGEVAKRKAFLHDGKWIIESQNSKGTLVMTNIIIDDGKVLSRNLKLGDVSCTRYFNKQ